MSSRQLAGARGAAKVLWDSQCFASFPGRLALRSNMASLHFQGSGYTKNAKGKNIQVVVWCRPFNASGCKSSAYAFVDRDQARKEVRICTGRVMDY